jgi:hypothetical protein
VVRLRESAVIDGFTITGGLSVSPYRHGGGVWMGTGSMLANCTVTGNEATRFGGGIYGITPATVINTVIKDNIAEISPNVHGSCLGIESDQPPVVPPDCNLAITQPLPCNPLANIRQPLECNPLSNIRQPLACTPLHNIQQPVACVPLHNIQQPVGCTPLHNIQQPLACVPLSIVQPK